MLNISTEKAGFPAGVLIRALEPIESITGNTRGPGALTKALNITRKLNNTDVTTAGDLYVADFKSFNSEEICQSPRIGISYAGEYKDKPWRFYVKNNPFVSRR